jgi:hypothetical protein
LSDRHSEGMRSPEVNSWKPLLYTVLLIIVSVALFPFRKALAGTVVRAGAYVIWMLNLTGRIIPQQVLWVFLLLLILYIAVGSFYGKRLRRGPVSRNTTPVVGPVEAITRRIEQGGRGTYFKWQIASLLGKIHLMNQVFASRGRSSRVPYPPPEVQSYLDAGVNTSYVDYVPPGVFQKGTHTPLDINLERVVEYLEEQMEIKHD